MFILKLSLPALIFAGFVFNGAQIDQNATKAQASTLITDSTPARDALTYRDDIMLTNSCVESGETKEHCLCVTKIFKHEMNVRQYHAAASLYSGLKKAEPTALMTSKLSLRQQGYSDTEIMTIHRLNAQLEWDEGFQARCDAAQSYFTSVES